MATIAEMAVRIGADTSDFTKDMGQIDKQFKKVSKDLKNASKVMSGSVSGVSDATMDMARKMKDAYAKQKEALKGFKLEQMAVKYQFFEMAQGAKDYAGTSKEFMGEVEALGKRHKQVTDNMMKNNELMKTSFIQSVGTMIARSGQSEKIAANFERMGNPLYTVNNGLLKIGSSLEGIARKGTPAVLALKQLGPTANMKELNDMTIMIQRGLMRMTALFIGAGIGLGIFTAAMAKAAKGPDPRVVWEQQEEALAAYEEAVKTRTTEILNTWDFFEKAQIEKTKPETLIKNLQSQVDVISQWRENLKKIIGKGIPQEMQDELEALGPQAAGQIAAMAQMSDKELAKYVELWREKHKLAKEAAVSELDELKQQTQQKIKELGDSLTPLGLSLESFKSTWASALQPFVEIWGIIASKVVDVFTAVGGFIEKLNEINPLISQAIGLFLFLFTALLVILSPLAIGIGLFGGMQAAISAVWMLLGPFITGFLAVAGTAAVVAAAIVGVGVAFYLLWTKTTWFKDAVMVAWEAIKQAFSVALNFIKSIFTSILGAVVAYGKEKLDQFKVFWSQNGEQIMQLVKVAFTIILNHIKATMQMIKGVFQIAWPIISGVVKVAWALIMSIIDTAIRYIGGIVKAGLAILRGDWQGAWKAISGITKNLGKDIIGNFKSINLRQIGKDIINGLLNGLGSMAGAIASKVKSLARLVPDGLKDFLNINSPSRVTMKLGEYAGQGLALGMERTFGDISNMSDDMASQAVPNFKSLNSLTRANNAVNSDSNRPVIQPAPVVIDGYELTRIIFDYIEERQTSKLGIQTTFGGVK